MKISNTITETRGYLQTVRDKKTTIGFVPTMGALHDGHLSLIKQAKNENGFVACSIFVNPIQFNNKTDLLKYPKNIDRDIEMLKFAKCDFLFYPSETEMYPEPAMEVFDFSGLDMVMEGQFRPGHFNGVAVVVKRLFDIIQPDKAYFGMKDFQQLVIIKKVVEDARLPIQIIPVQTVRENDGLAMSSRNQLLEPDARRQAPMIYKALQMVKIKADNSTIPEIKDYIEQLFQNHKDAKLEYFEIVDMFTLVPIKTWADRKNVIACIAVYYGNIRLIDNMILFS